MFKKDFVSVNFTQAKIQLLSLNSKKNSVDKYISIPLPPGVIVNHKVTAPDKLVAALVGGIKKAGFKQKFAAIVVPEFSTYSKLLSLPKLSDKEIGEAIQWQSQEFLPAAEAEMLLDWRIAKEEDGHYQIMVSAIRKDLLADYINATSKAGLLPLVVETPSISLNRISEGDDIARLFIYVSPDESILTLSQGKKVLGGSVANSSSQNEIINTAVRMVNYYSNLGIKAIRLGGANLSEEFVNVIKKAINLPVEQITTPVKAPSEQIKQEYLIPISLQFKDPVQPADSSTINLLPLEWVAKYQSELKGIQVWTLTLICSIIVWATFLSVVIFYMLLSSRLQALEQEAPSVAQVTSNEVVAETNRINKLSQKVVDYFANNKYPIDYVNEISSLKPDGVRLETLDLNIESGVFTITGRAANRANLSSFKDNLEANEKFSGVDLPNTYLVQDSDNFFKIDFVYAQNKSKPVPKLKIN